LGYLKTGILMGVLFALFMGLGQVLGGSQGLMIGFGMALVMNLGAYWFSDKMALAMSGAREVSEAEAPGLHRMVARLARNASLPVPRVAIIPSPQPNAFATGRSPSHAAVAVTEGIVDALTDEELEGVVAHELAHIKNRDVLISTIAAVFVGTISYLTQFAMFTSMFRSNDDEEGGTNPLVAVFVMIVGGIAATMIQLAISRSREYEADRVGGQICRNPGALASALLKIERIAERAPVHVNPATSHMYIVNPLGGDMLRGLQAAFRTHPLTEDRVRRLNQQARQAA
jgi:heat shock protein HtpX